MSGHLIILGCSQRKRPNTEPFAAIERYDGPLFQVLRKFRRDAPTVAYDLYVVSAHYGVIPGTQPIPHYDRAMTKQRANELRGLCFAALNELGPRYQTAFVSLGLRYWEATGGLWLQSLPAQQHVATGGMGQRAAQLKAWLHGLRKERPHV